MERSTDTQTQIGPAVTQIDSNLEVTAKVTAPTMLVGDENKTCCIEVTNDNRMLITLPTTGKGPIISGETQTYDMRSIIESIQELNRRTATFDCNVSFTSAMAAFDTSSEPNDAFACDQDVDGLPAAQIGEINIEQSSQWKSLIYDADVEGGSAIATIGTGTTNSISHALTKEAMENLINTLSNYLGGG